MRAFNAPACYERFFLAVEPVFRYASDLQRLLHAIALNIGHGRQFTQKEKENLCLRLFEMDTPTDETAVTLAVSETTVYRWTKSRRTQSKEGQQGKALELHTKGMTQGEIAKELGITRKRVRTLLGPLKQMQERAKDDSGKSTGDDEFSDESKGGSEDGSAGSDPAEQPNSPGDENTDGQPNEDTEEDSAEDSNAETSEASEAAEGGEEDGGDVPEAAVGEEEAPEDRLFRGFREAAELVLANIEFYQDERTPPLDKDIFKHKGFDPIINALRAWRDMPNRVEPDGNE